MTALSEIAKFRIRAHHVRRATWATASLIGLAMFFVIGVVARFAMGPVPLGLFSGQLRDAIHDALPGVGVSYDDAALEWSRDESRFNLIVIGARVLDAGQHIIAQAPKAEIGLAAVPLMQGKIQVGRIDLVGVQLTLDRDRQGILHLGTARNQAEGDVLQRIRDAIEKSGKGATTLSRFAVSKARLAFYDESSGLFVVAPLAKLEVANDRASPSHMVSASVDADVEISGRPAHVVGTFKLPKAGPAVSGDISISGLELKALADNTKSLAFLSPFDLKTDVSGSFIFGAGAKLRSADLSIGGSGSIGGMGSPLKVQSFNFVGRYDGVTGRVLIDDASLQGANTKAHFAGTGDLRFGADGLLQGGDVEISGDQIAIGFPSQFLQSVTMGHIFLRGRYSAADRVFSLDRFGLNGPAVSSELSGRIVLADNTSPAIEITGKISGLSIRDLVRYWPLRAGQGARNWVAANVLQGRIGPIVTNVNIRQGDLEKTALPEDALSLAFPVKGASVNYIHGLTPLTNADGNCVLTGDTFKAYVTSARVGPLAVDNASVVIPNLHLHATVADIKTSVQGQMHDLLTLLDMKPLGYPTRFHINPKDTAGVARVDSEFRVPTLSNVGVDQIGMSIKAKATGLALSLANGMRITDGMADFEIDNQRMHAVGNVSVGHTRVAADWSEDFNTRDDITTKLVVRGSLDDSALASLHFDVSDILAGPIGMTTTLYGHRGTLRRAAMAADLTPATLSLNLVSYVKPPGTPATASIAATFGAKGTISAADISISGNALSAQGSLNFASGGMSHAEFPIVRAGPNNDFSLSMSQSQAAGLEISIKGASADGSGFGKTNSSLHANEAGGRVTPLHVTAALDRIALRGGVTLSPFALDLTQSGDQVQSLSINVGGKSNGIAASIKPVAEGRKLSVDAANAGVFLKGVLGLQDISGGQLSVSAKLPPAGAAGKSLADTGVLTMRDFKIENQPFFARLFSAGSLGGLLDLMRGKGIVIDQLTLPFSAKNDVITIRDAHANGPSVGLSGEGYIDRRSNKLDLRGAVAPIYGLNGVLNAIPLLGDVLTSKKGEGIFGVTYEASGNLDEPRITVNPLAMLTPGIFRRIFEGAAPSAPAQAEATPAPAPKPQTGAPH